MAAVWTGTTDLTVFMNQLLAAAKAAGMATQPGSVLDQIEDDLQEGLTKASRSPDIQSSVACTLPCRSKPMNLWRLLKTSNARWLQYVA
jgi:hypothetical protein